MMPVRTGWYIKGQVLMMQFREDVPDEEFIQAANHPSIISTMETSPAPLIHVMMQGADIKPDRKTPSLKIAGKIPVATHPKLGWVVVANYQGSRILQMVMAIVTQLTNIRYRFVANHHDAIQFLREVDPHLPEFPPETEIQWFNYVNWH